MPSSRSGIVRAGSEPSADGGIRGGYEALGVDLFYRLRGGLYRNPHEETVRRVVIEALRRDGVIPLSALDLACGSGEVTRILAELGVGKIDGVDPYTGSAYLERTGSEAIRLTFEQVALGGLAGRSYGLIVCSFALHLVERSWLPRLLHSLAGLITSERTRLLVITPHKRPEIRPEWGWVMQHEFLIDRVRGRIYQPQLLIG